MCRWLAYSGEPLRIEQLLYETDHSLIDQSLHARETVTTTNGDGFGLGWYGDGEPPGLYRSVRPAWNDRNLRELAARIRSPLFLAHVRSSTGTAVQQTNCHPFRHGSWLFMHNGVVREFASLKRELVLAVDPRLFARIEGTTDSEVLLYLALTFGLEQEPLLGLERMAGFVEELGRRRGVGQPLHLAACVSDGRRLIAVRYSSEGRTSTLYASREVRALKALYRGNPLVERLGAETRVIVSEPLISLPDAWQALDEGTALVVEPGADRTLPFVPRSPQAG
ncbi:MAG TPA: class II glutamine amidotransferase [Candidatus Polarisedimenticolaceae bacterium]|nr:class II glutamine amidotransferase [Candidatus Polarisedimenticolaceae bacterium]